MLSFSVNSEKSNTINYVLEDKPDLTLEQIGNGYRWNKAGKECISVETDNRTISIQSLYLKKVNPFLYKVSSVENQEGMSQVTVETNERITSVTSKDQELRICTNNSSLEFKIQNGKLVLTSNKCLSFDSEQNSFQMMKF